MSENIRYKRYVCLYAPYVFLRQGPRRFAAYSRKRVVAGRYLNKKAVVIRTYFSSCISIAAVKAHAESAAGAV